jgi:hypothetical protein
MDKKIKLYHRKVYLPQALIEQVISQQKNIERYKFSNHLRQRFNDTDKSHNQVTFEKVLGVIKCLKYKPLVPFEVETRMVDDMERVTKYVIRKKCSYKEDICLVIRGCTIITAYINNSRDKHPTLDKSKYVKF